MVGHALAESNIVFEPLMIGESTIESVDGKITVVIHELSGSLLVRHSVGA